MKSNDGMLQRGSGRKQMKEHTLYGSYKRYMLTIASVLGEKLDSLVISVEVH